MKKSLIIASLLSLGTTLLTADEQYFIGIGAERVFGKTKSYYKESYNGSILQNVNVSHNWKDTNIYVKTGVILEKEHRLSFDFHHAKEDYENNVEETLQSYFINYDYLIPIHERARFYIGTHAGFTHLKANFPFIYTFKANSFAYGAQLGTILDITKNLEFELGARYTILDLKDSAKASSNGYELEAGYKINKLVTLNGGINLKF